MRLSLIRLLALMALAVLVGVLGVTPGRAGGGGSTIVVSTTSDVAPTAGECVGVPYVCSLRQAIDAASSGDVIQLSGTAGTPNVYTLTLGSTLLISGKDLTITGNGPDATVIDGLGNLGPPGSQQYRIMKTGGGLNVSISGVTFRNGIDAQDESFAGGFCTGGCPTLSGYGGGALFNGGGHVLLDDVAFTNNAGSPTPVGGAVSNVGGTLEMTDVSFTGDSAAFGGGLFVHSGTVTGTGLTFANDGDGSFGGGAVFLAGGVTTLKNTTIVGSGWASSRGGGIENSGGSLTLVNDTFSGNLRGAIQTDQVGGATTSVENTIIGAGFSDNVDYGCVDAGRATNAGPTTAAAITTDLGHNVDQDGHCNLSLPSDFSNVDPKLASLADNGGPTQTQALIAGSPALDAAADADCPATDQRGTPRAQRPICDIGAFEARIFGAPQATTDAAQNVGQNQADLCGKITLTGEAGGFHFVWGTSPGALSNVTDVTGIGVVSSDTAESQMLTGLSPGTTYYFKAVADNATASVPAGNVLSFTTLAGPPAISSVQVAAVDDISALIDFTIDPQGADTTYTLEYGLTAGYGQTIGPIDIGSAAGAQALHATLSGLSPNSTYHFDVFASNSVQQNVHYGDQTFTTARRITGTAGSAVGLTDSGTAGECPVAPTIAWGDGTQSSNGDVVCVPNSADGQDYTVTASHTYAAAGHYHVQLTYSDISATSDLYAQIGASAGCVVPNVKSMLLAAAKSAIVAAQCGVGPLNWIASKTVPSHHVISQYPAPGKHMKKGSKITLFVSLGKI